MKKTLTTAIMLACVPLLHASGSGENVEKTPQGRMLPESYQQFFPTSSMKTLDEMSCKAESFSGRAVAKSVKRPFLSQENPRMTAADGANGNLYGYLYFFQGDALQRGFYRINSSATPTFLWSDSYTADWSMNMTSGWLRNGNLCGVNSMAFMGGILAYGQIELDFRTGEVVDFKPLRNDGTDVGNVYITMAYRDLDDKVYGYGHTADGGAYCFKSAEAADIDTSATVKEVDFEEVCVSLCYNVQDDKFYGVSSGGAFVQIDAKGNQTKLFDLNVANFSSTVTGLVYSPKDRKYIWNAYLKDNTSRMYAIDPVAKTATRLYNCASGEEFIYMVCPDDNVTPGAPATLSSVTYDFRDGSLDGTVSFSLPGRAADGTSLSGNLDWRILIDGELAKSGTGAAGSKVNVPLENVAEGMRTFAVSSGKNGEYSVPSIKSFWVGSDYPLAPANLRLTETTLDWDAVTGSVHDGYVDLSAVKYIVYLNDNIVGETSSTSHSIELPQGQPFNSYTAKVVAVADGKRSEPGVSNFITYGEPLEIGSGLHYRPEPEEFELFQAIDIDGKTDSEGNTRNWHYSETMGFPSFASGADGEDLLVFPPINFSNTEKAYCFRMEAGLIHDRDKTGSIEVLIGKEPTLEAMTQVIMPAYKPQYMLGDYLSEYFAVNEPGTYYIGILTKTNEVGIHISDMDVSLTDRAADVPMSVEDLKAEAGADGALTAKVSFTMPAKTVNGKVIDANTDITATVTSRVYVHNHPDQGDVTATKTVTGKPGSAQTVEIETAQNLNTIGVACAIGARKGSESVTSLYTGLVKPYTVQNLKAQVTEDNMGVKLSWTPPVDGETEGPIGDSFLYTIWYYADGWKYLGDAGWNTLENLVELPEGSEQQILMVGVMAYNAAGQSDHISSLACVIGTPYNLPMLEDFPRYEETYSPIAQQRPTSDYNGSYWMVDDPAQVGAIFANSSKVAYIGYIGQEGVQTASSRLSMPKFSTVGMKDVKFTLTYWGGPYAAPFSLLANKYGLDIPVSVGDFPQENGWVSNSLVIPAEFNEQKWVELLLDNKFPNTNTFALFSGYSISGVSGVEGVDMGVEGRIFTSGGMLHVAGLAGESLMVTDLAGHVVVSVPELEDLAGFVLAPGVYVAKAGAHTAKVILR